MKRVPYEFSRLPGDANILPGHEAERASWIWAPTRAGAETAFLRFSLEFDWQRAARVQLHVTADQRFQLFLDGRAVCFGPDRCDVAHWSVATLEADLSAGRHRLEVLAWYIAESHDGNSTGEQGKIRPPMAQMSHRPGFLGSSGKFMFRPLLGQVLIREGCRV